MREHVASAPQWSRSGRAVVAQWSRSGRGARDHLIQPYSVQSHSTRVLTF